MTAPIALRMAFDSGWSHGDPGDGRLRFDSPSIAKAVNIIVNARDAQEALLDELVPSWRVGDVLVIERPGADRNRVVAWVIGPITHMGPCYRVPILVRSVHGGFAAHDEVALHHHRNVTDVDEAPVQLRDVTPAPAVRDAPALSAPPIALIAEPEVAPFASGRSLPVSPLLPVAPANAHDANGASSAAGDGAPSELAALRADNAALHDILAGLLTDTTELYAVEGTP